MQQSGRRSPQDHDGQPDAYHEKRPVLVPVIDRLTDEPVHCIQRFRTVPRDQTISGAVDVSVRDHDASEHWPCRPDGQGRPEIPGVQAWPRWIESGAVAGQVAGPASAMAAAASPLRRRLGQSLVSVSALVRPGCRPVYGQPGGVSKPSEFALNSRHVRAGRSNRLDYRLHWLDCMLRSGV